MLQSESCVSFEVHYWQCFKIILNFYIKFFGNSNAIMNYFFLQFIYKFISMTLFSTQPTSGNLEAKNFLQIKEKLLDALSTETTQNFVWRSLTYCVTSSSYVIWLFQGFYVIFDFLLTSFTHEEIAVSSSLCFNLRLPENSSLARSNSSWHLQ